MTHITTDAKADKDPSLRFERAYEELCRIARGNRFVGKSVETMQAQALVHETFIHLQKRFFELPSLRNAEPRDYLLRICPTGSRSPMGRER